MPWDKPLCYFWWFSHWAQSDISFIFSWDSTFVQSFTKNSPPDCLFDTKFQVTPLDSQKHQGDRILIQCSECLFKKNMAACFFFVRFFTTRLACDLRVHIWYLTDFAMLHTSHHHQDDRGSAPQIVSSPQQILHLPRGFRNPPHVFWHFAGIDRTWWILQWQGLELIVKQCRKCSRLKQRTTLV